MAAGTGTLDREEGLKRLVGTLEGLCALDGPAGFEQPVISRLEEEFRPLSDRVELDRFGNLYALRQGAGRAPRLMLAAHADEVGLLVKSVEDAGFLRFEKLGGVADHSLPGTAVVVGGRHHGVVGLKSSHLMTPAERDRVPPYREMYLDVGAPDANAVAEMGIRPGDPVCFHAPLRRLGPNRVAGKAIDDRTGCTLLLELFRHLQGLTPAGDLWAVITVQEEVGLRGAQVAAYRVNPDYAVAVDTIAAGDTPETAGRREQPVGIGKGPALVLASEGSRAGSIAHPKVWRYLQEAASRAGVACQTALMIGYGTTDAAAIHLAREGVPTGGLSIPRRFAHSAQELLDLGDMWDGFRVLCALVEGMEGHRDLGFL
ncbi:MAG: M42 family metallopeptidase [Acetobacteraceae bacterium]|nr:M42 family metallopeptidase [Acetobacteraceae bacterium]